MLASNTKAPMVTILLCMRNKRIKLNIWKVHEFLSDSYLRPLFFLSWKKVTGHQMTWKYCARGRAVYSYCHVDVRHTCIKFFFFSFFSFNESKILRLVWIQDCHNASPLKWVKVICSNWTLDVSTGRWEVYLSRCTRINFNQFISTATLPLFVSANRLRAIKRNVWGKKKFNFDF